MQGAVALRDGKEVALVLSQEAEGNINATIMIAVGDRDENPSIQTLSIGE